LGKRLFLSKKKAFLIKHIRQDPNKVRWCGFNKSRQLGTKSANWGEAGLFKSLNNAVLKNLIRTLFRYFTLLKVAYS
jgi:hypothetical protein